MSLNFKYENKVLENLKLRIMTKVKKKISFEGQNIYVGMDVHKIQWTICVCTEHSNFRPFTMDPDPEILIDYLRREFPDGDYLCAYEAGFSGFGLCEALWESKISCIIVHAADIPTSHKEAEFKTDKRDALKIAKSLRSRELSGIFIPDKQLQEDRSLIRFRHQLRKDIVRQKCRIKSLLDFYGVVIPKEWVKSKWSKGMRNWLWNLNLCTEEGTRSIRLRMEILEHIREMCLTTDQHLRDLSRMPRHKSQTDLLMTVVGFGRLRSIEFLVELGDIKRFKNLDSLSNYVGLVPSSNNSGNRVSQGELTTRGHKQLRTMLIEAAWVSMNTDPAMAKKYGELKKRMLGQQAIVSIARKLLNRVRYVLINEVAYQKGIEA